MSVPFSPTVAPSFPLDDTHTPKVNRLTFGNGYTQRSLDGINADLEKLTVKWENLTLAEYQYIWGFMKARAGVEAFTYAVPWEPGLVTRKYICGTYGRSKTDAGAYAITCSWEEVVEA